MAVKFAVLSVWGVFAAVISHTPSDHGLGLLSRWFPGFAILNEVNPHKQTTTPETGSTMIHVLLNDPTRDVNMLYNITIPVNTFMK